MAVICMNESEPLYLLLSESDFQSNFFKPANLENVGIFQEKIPK